MDDAGNAAKTVWRDIIVEEVDLLDVEKKVRAELAAEKEEEIAEAIRKAKDDAAAEQVEIARAHEKKPDRYQRGRGPTACPKCPECKCTTGDNSFDPSQCEDYCAMKAAESKSTCTPGESPTVMGPINFLQDKLPVSVMEMLCWIVAAFLLVRTCLTAVFDSRAYDTYNYPDERELQNAESRFRSEFDDIYPFSDRSPRPQGWSVGGV